MTLIQSSTFASGKPFLFSFSFSTSLPPLPFLFFTIPKYILVKSLCKLQKQYMLIKWYKFIANKSSCLYVPWSLYTSINYFVHNLPDTFIYIHKIEENWFCWAPTVCLIEFPQVVLLCPLTKDGTKGKRGYVLAGVTADSERWSWNWTQVLWFRITVNTVLFLKVERKCSKPCSLRVG